ncbi:hypothetical protein [Streptomyces sp. NPDC054849]
MTAVEVVTPGAWRTVSSTGRRLDGEIHHLGGHLRGHRRRAIMPNAVAVAVTWYGVDGAPAHTSFGFTPGQFGRLVLRTPRLLLLLLLLWWETDKLLARRSGGS